MTRGLLPAPVLLALAVACACAGPRPAGGEPSREPPLAETAGTEDAPAHAEEASEREPARLDALLDPIRERHGVPGLAAAVVYRGRIAGLGVSGVRVHGGDVPVTLDDRWHLGSCTKSMTALLAARLAERGVVSLDATLPELFPDLADAIHPGYRGVSLARLLAHRGGTPTDPSAELYQVLLELPPVAGRARLTREILSEPPALEPGSAWFYSNAGYSIAGAALERAAGEPWETLVEREVFGPCGMASGGFGPPGVFFETADAASEPWGHVASEGEVRSIQPSAHADNPTAFGPAGTAHASIADLARYAAVHLAGARGESELVSPESWRRLHEPLEGESYALGWMIEARAWARGNALTHAGSNRMWFAVIWIGPERDLALVAASNQGGVAASACDDAVRALLFWFRDEVGAGER